MPVIVTEYNTDMYNNDELPPCSSITATDGGRISAEILRNNQ